MGYTTQFKGELKFTHDITVKQLRKLNEILGEDFRDHPEWKWADQSNHGLDNIDLETTEYDDGIRWNGAEKTYEMTDLVNGVIRLMRLECPEFGLTGSIFAQGEEIGDVWILEINPEGWATKREIELTGKIVTCPHCEEQFIFEGI